MKTESNMSFSLEKFACGVLPKWTRYIALLVTILISYLLLAELTLWLVSPLSSFTAVWCPTGIAIAAMHLKGYRVWPAIALGAAIVVYQISHLPGLAFGAAVADTIEACMATFLFRYFRVPSNPTEQVGSLLKFLLIATLASTSSATVGIISGRLAGFYNRQELWYVWFSWWIENAGGALVVAPLILAWAGNITRPLSWRRALELLGVLFLIGLITVGAFTDVYRFNVGHYPLEYLCTPLLVYLAWRFGVYGASVGLFLMSVLAIFGTYRGFGPLYRVSKPQTLHLTQIYIGTNAVFTVILATVFTEWKKIQEQLKRSNAELSKFIYVASHDLKEPLRNVSNFSELLLRENRGRLDADARSHLSYIISGVKHMYGVIDSLLNYVHLEHGLDTKSTDCNEVFDQAVKNLQTLIVEKKARINRTTLPTITSNPSILVHLFQNLVGNALKFSGPVQPIIDVSAELQDRDWVFRVRDNGIGIDKKYFDKIFLLFRRAVGDKTAPSGTGVGLAICKKIVEEHGGRIWVESQPGRGSSFLFTLPTQFAGYPPNHAQAL